MKESPVQPEPDDTLRTLILSAVLVAVVVLVVHAGGLKGDLLGSDRLLVDRSPISGLRAAEGTSVLPPWLPRATAALSLALDRSLWGPSPFAFRATNLVLHLAACLALLVLARRRLRSAAAGLGAAVLFAVHPVNVEGIVRAGARGEILAGLFVFLALALIERAGDNREAGHPWRSVAALSVLLYVAGTFASALALVALPLLALDDILLARGSSRHEASRKGRWILFAAASVPALAISLAAARPVLPRNPLLAGRALFEGIRLLVLPFPLDYYRVLGPASGAGAFAMLCLPGAVLFLGACAILIQKKDPGRFASALSGPGGLAAAALIPGAYIALAYVLDTPAWLPAAAIPIAAAGVLLLMAGPGADRSGAAMLMLLPLLALVLFPPSGPGLDVPFPLQECRLYLPAAGFSMMLAGLLTALGAASAQASPALRRALMTAPIVLVAIPFSAVSFWRQGQFENDVALYIASSARSSSMALRVELARAADAAGQTDKAIEMIKRLIVRTPEDAGLHLLLANLLRDISDLDAAEEETRSALKLDPALGPAQLTLGLIERERGDPSKAEAAYREAIRISPDLSEAHSNLGAVLQARGATVEALSELKRAVELDPGNGDAAANLGSILLDQRLTDDALAVLRRGLTFAEGNPRLHYNLGVALQRSGNAREASQAYLEAIRINPTYARPRFNLAAIYSDQKKFEDAVSQLRRVIELEPRNERAHYNLGLAYRALGRNDLATVEFLAALRLRPDYPEANRAMREMINRPGK